MPPPAAEGVPAAIAKAGGAGGGGQKGRKGAGGEGRGGGKRPLNPDRMERKASREKRRREEVRELGCVWYARKDLAPRVGDPARCACARSSTANCERGRKRPMIRCI